MRAITLHLNSNRVSVYSERIHLHTHKHTRKNRRMAVMCRCGVYSGVSHFSDVGCNFMHSRIHLFNIFLFIVYVKTGCCWGHVQLNQVVCTLATLVVDAYTRTHILTNTYIHFLYPCLSGWWWSCAVDTHGWSAFWWCWLSIYALARSHDQQYRIALVPCKRVLAHYRQYRSNAPHTSSKFWFYIPCLFLFVFINANTRTH